MAEGNPTEFLIENDEKFIGEFIKFMGVSISDDYEFYLFYIFVLKIYCNYNINKIYIF